MLESIKVLVRGGDFDAAAPTTTAVEVPSARIRNLGAINHKLVIVKPLILRPRHSDPGAIVAPGQRVLSTTEKLEADALRLRCDDAGEDAPFRVDLGMLFAGLIEGGGLPVVRRSAGLGEAKRAKDEGNKHE
jgi:hypothetical protein